MTHSTTSNKIEPIQTTSNQLQLLVFDAYPIRHRTSIWKAINQLAPNSTHVVYASSCFAKGYQDEGFGVKITWEETLLEGYTYTVLHNENGTSFSGWNSLTGKGIRRIIRQLHPKTILLTGLNYRFDQVALLEAKRAGIPVSLRCENQDVAFPRAIFGKKIRSMYYKMVYRFIHRFYYIGQLNKQHYLQHRIKESQLLPAHYFTVDRFAKLTDAQKATSRKITRLTFQIREKNQVVGFSGKFTPQKNPEILFKMLDHLPVELRSTTVLYFIGSGILQERLEELAKLYKEKYGTKTIFTGFVNQSAIAHHYLVMDTLVLPSRQMGETWGLVVNEAMQAGCNVVTSNFVGCSADFKTWERFEIFQDNNEQDLAIKVEHLMQNERTFNWASERLKDYSLKNCVDQLLSSLIQEPTLPLNSSTLQSLNP